MLNDVAARGRAAARDTILVGSRGVDKTALLTAFAQRARAPKAPSSSTCRRSAGRLGSSSPSCSTPVD